MSKSALAFEDMGSLQDPMDKRIDLDLKRTWDSTVANLKPALATTCVAPNLEFWLSQLLAHLQSGSPREEFMDSFPILFKVVGYIADASTESVQMSARTSAMAVLARRAFRLKFWSGDATYKSRLCSLPVQGDLLFGPELDSVLERTSDKKKMFLEVKKAHSGQRFFHGHEDRGQAQGTKLQWQAPKGRGKGSVLFHPPTSTNRPK